MCNAGSPGSPMLVDMISRWIGWRPQFSSSRSATTYGAIGNTTDPTTPSVCGSGESTSLPIGMSIATTGMFAAFAAVTQGTPVAGSIDPRMIAL